MPLTCRLIAFFFCLALTNIALANPQAVICSQGSGPAGGASWSEVWTAEDQTGDTTWANSASFTDGKTRIQVVEAAHISNSGTQIRITLIGNQSSGGSWSFDDCYIGERSTTGDDYDFASSPTQITFSAGAGGTVTQDGTLTSDNISFSLDSTKDYLIAMYFDGSAYSYCPYLDEGSNGYNSYYKGTASSESATVDKSGYYDNSGRYLLFLQSLEAYY